MMVLPSFVLLWSSSIRFLRGGAGSSVGTASIVYVACGTAWTGLRSPALLIYMVVCRGCLLHRLPRLWAAVLAVARAPKLLGAGCVPVSFGAEACLEQSSEHAGTAGWFKRWHLISRAKLVGGV